VKREKLRIEHDKNLIEIQLKQLEEVDRARQMDDETKVQ
jgi:hypothetical protein